MGLFCRIAIPGDPADVSRETFLRKTGRIFSRAPIVGIGGLAKAVVGFFAGAFAQQFIVTATLPRLLIFVVATVVHAAVLMGLYTVLQSGTLAASWTMIAKQALGNALVGAVAFAVVEAVPGVMERRRIARRSRH